MSNNKEFPGMEDAIVAAMDDADTVARQHGERISDIARMAFAASLVIHLNAAYQTGAAASKSTPAGKEEGDDK